MVNGCCIRLFWILSVKLNPQLIMREWHYTDEEAGIEVWNNSKCGGARVCFLSNPTEGRKKINKRSVPLTRTSSELAPADGNHARNGFSWLRLMFAFSRQFEYNLRRSFSLASGILRDIMHRPACWTPADLTARVCHRLAQDTWFVREKKRKEKKRKGAVIAFLSHTI